MIELWPILADSEDTVKVVIGVIILMFWLIGAVAKSSMQSAKTKAARQRAEWERLSRLQQQQQGYSPQYPQQVQQQPQRPQRGPMVPPMRNVQQQPQYRPQPQQRQQQQRQQQQRPQPAPQRRGNTAVTARQQRRMQEAQRRTQRSLGPKPPPLPPSLAVPVVTDVPGVQELGSTPDVAGSEIGAGTTHASPTRRQAAAAAAAPVIRLTPQTLRQQFILTEILQAPLALRDRPPGV